MTMPLLSTKAPEPPDFINNITHDDDDSNITKVFNDFTVDHENETAPPAYMHKPHHGHHGRYFACTMTPGNVQGHVFLDLESKLIFKNQHPMIPLAIFTLSLKQKHMPDLPSSLLHILLFLTTCQPTFLTLPIMQCHQWGDIIITQ